VLDSLVFTGQQNGGCRTIRFRNDINGCPIGQRVPTQQKPLDVPERYLVHFGLLGRRKGTDIVAEALPLAWRDEPGIRMVWAGTMRTDHAVVMTRYRQLWGGLADSVSWLGPLRKPTLYQLVKGAVASVLPSRADNLPNTAIERSPNRTP